MRFSRLYLSAPPDPSSLRLGQEVGNSAVPAVTPSCSLDVNNHSSPAEKRGRRTELSKRLMPTAQRFTVSVKAVWESP